jgi:site-specific DNA-methyltransferase (adenine-specific)
LYNELNQEFRFTVDVCATKENSKVWYFFTKEQDGLSVSWKNHNCWMNPPYGRAIGNWVRKAAESNTLVVCLLPAKTDTRWFHDYIYGKAEIRFLKGRLRFSNSKNPAPFPSMVVIFKANP